MDREQEYRQTREAQAASEEILAGERREAFQRLLETKGWALVHEELGRRMISHMDSALRVRGEALVEAQSRYWALSDLQHWVIEQASLPETAGVTSEGSRKSFVKGLRDG